MTRSILLLIACVPWSVLVLGGLALWRKRKSADRVSAHWLKQLDQRSQRVHFDGVRWKFPVDNA